MPVLPLFPLGAVLLPGMPLPLTLFEERYRRLGRDLLDLPADARRFGVVAIRQGSEVGDGETPALHAVGCVALVTTLDELPDGRFQLEATGTGRFRLGELDASLPYLRADIEPLPEDAGDAGGVPALVERRYRDYVAALGAVRGVTLPAEQADLPTDPVLLSYLVAATTILDAAERQALLAADDAAERLRLEARLLSRETALLQAFSSVPGAALVRVPTSPN